VYTRLHPTFKRFRSQVDEDPIHRVQSAVHSHSNSDAKERRAKVGHRDQQRGKENAMGRTSLVLLLTFLLLQTRTHNHTTNKTLFDSYVGTDVISEDTAVAQGVATLYGANASNRHIAKFISDELGEWVKPISV
jgi:hypothetical protein